MTKNEHFRLWAAVHEYVVACGGRIPQKKTKDISKVIHEVDRVVNKIEDRVEEDFAARCLT